MFRKYLSLFFVLFALVCVLTVLAVSVGADAGDGFDSAQIISVNVNYSDYISGSNDLDYFRFTINNPGTVSIQLSHPDLVDTNEFWSGILYNDRHDEICVYSFDANGLSETSYSVGLDKGTYYILLRPGNYSSSWNRRYTTDSYSVRVNYTATEYCEKENNDSFVSSTLINSNAYYTGSINDNNDLDYYKFTLPEPGVVSLTMKKPDLVNTAEFWSAILYNERQNEICTYSFDANGEEQTAYTVGLDRGTYYILLRPGNYSSSWNRRYTTASYSIRVNFSATELCEKENNDSFVSSTAISLNKFYTGSINDSDDVDYYKFTISNPGLFHLDITKTDLVNTNDFWGVVLYNDRHEEVFTNSFDANGTEGSTPVVGLRAGTYYILIRPGNYSSSWNRRYTTDNYSIKADFSATEYCEKENNESFSDATELKIGKGYYTTIKGSGDKDYFVFRPSGGKEVTLSFERRDLVVKDEYWIIEFFDERQNKIDSFSIDRNGTVFTADLGVLESTNYYLVISHNRYRYCWDLNKLTLNEICGGGEQCPGRYFRDMPLPNNWAHSPIDWAVSKNITKGTSKYTFSPNDTCTRAQIVTFLWRAKGCPEPTNKNNPFTDVKSKDFFYKAVLWAVENNVTSGVSKTRFGPDQGCTRGQVVTFLWRAEGTPRPKNNTNPFRDVKKDDYYYSAVLWAVETGITNGVSSYSFAPSSVCTRAQIVSFLYRDLVK